MKLAEELGLGARINVIMQTAFFKISNIIPAETAIKAIKDAIKKSYGKAGERVVSMNNQAVDATIENLFEVKVPKKATSKITIKSPISPDALRNSSGTLPRRSSPVAVISFPFRRCRRYGTFPTGSSCFEKRNIAVEIPQWDKDLCIQCAICSFVCPHATIRMKVSDPSAP